MVSQLESKTLAWLALTHDLVHLVKGNDQVLQMILASMVMRSVRDDLCNNAADPFKGDPQLCLDNGDSVEEWCKHIGIQHLTKCHEWLA